MKNIFISRQFASVFTIVAIQLLGMGTSLAQYRTVYNTNLIDLNWGSLYSWEELISGQQGTSGIYNNAPASIIPTDAKGALTYDVQVLNSIIYSQPLLTVGGGKTLHIYSPNTAIPLDFYPNATTAQSSDDSTYMIIGDENPLSPVEAILKLNGTGNDTASVVVHPGATLIITGYLDAQGNAKLTVMDGAKLIIRGGQDRKGVEVGSESVGSFLFQIDGEVEINGNVDMRGNVNWIVTDEVTVNGNLLFSGSVDITLSGYPGEGIFNMNGDIPPGYCSTLWSFIDEDLDGNGTVADYDDWFDQGTPHVYVTGPASENVCLCWDGPPEAITGAACGTLPVELMDFSAESSDTYVGLYWETAWEEVNDYFTVERSADGINFSIIGTVEGKGTTSDNQDYTFEDHSPLMGIAYYRLSQTDFDGTTVVLGMLPVNYNTQLNALMVYPNPVQNGSLTVQLYGIEKQQRVYLDMADMGGREILKETWLTGSGYIDRAINVDHLNKGIYILTIRQGSVAYRKKIIRD